MHKLAGILSLLILISCKVDPKIVKPSDPDNVVEIIPDGWPKPAYTFSANTISKEKFALGRALFYETLLSKNDSISCSSCHQQFVAFSNYGHPVSHGIHELFGKRNAPAIFNVTWIPLFMHDGGINNIEVQPLGPISNTVEMAEDISNVIAKLNASLKYRNLFKNAYGSDEINSQKMLRAMAVFMGMMYSNNSKYDYYKRKEDNVTFSESELRGYNLFLSKCNACHTEPLFTDYQFRSNGLPVDPFLLDSGRARITGLAEDRFRFKTPSLRNIAKTGPYMHDGRFSTLEECLDHYTGGITNTINLDPLLANGIQLSDQDKKDIIAFLNTLTDYKFVNDKRFSDPNFN